MSNSVELEPLVEELSLPERVLVLADKGYVGQRYEAVLEARGLKNGSMEKDWQNNPLPKETKTRNLPIDNPRYVAE